MSSDEVYSSISEAEMDKVLQYVTRHGEPKGLNAIIIGTDTGISYQRVTMIIDRLLASNEIHVHKRDGDKHVYYRPGPDPEKVTTPAPVEAVKDELTCRWCHEVKKDTRQKIRAHEVHCPQNPDALMTPNARAKKKREKEMESTAPNVRECAGCSEWKVLECAEKREDYSTCPKHAELANGPAEAAETTESLLDAVVNDRPGPEPAPSEPTSEQTAEPMLGTLSQASSIKEEQADQGKSELAGWDRKETIDPHNGDVTPHPAPSCDNHEPEENVNTIALSASNPVQEMQVTEPAEVLERPIEQVSGTPDGWAVNQYADRPEPAPRSSDMRDKQAANAMSGLEVAEVLRSFGQRISTDADGEGFQSTVEFVEHQENGQKLISLFITLRKGVLQEERRQPQVFGLRLR